MILVVVIDRTGAAGGYVTCALANLRWHWGDAYRIAADADGWDGTWTATRRDNHRVLTATNPRELSDLIVADYSSRPVPRQ